MITQNSVETNPATNGVPRPYNPVIDNDDEPQVWWVYLGNDTRFFGAQRYRGTYGEVCYFAVKLAEEKGYPFYFLRLA